MMTLYDRQLGLFDPSSPSNQIPVIVIGAGTIGSWTTFALAKLGVSDITVCDFDDVEEQNIPNQMYSPVLFEQPPLSKVHEKKKVFQLKSIIERMTGGETSPWVYPRKFDNEVIDDTREDTHSSMVVISAVDSMTARKEIWEIVKSNKQDVVLYIDARIGGNVAKILTLPLKQAIQHEIEQYESSLHSDDTSTIANEEVKHLSDLPCTMRSIIDVSMATAAVITNQYRNFVTKHTIPSEIHIDMSNGFSMSSVWNPQQTTPTEDIPTETN